MPPPGYDTATLAIAGAVLGAILGGRRNAAGGAIIGATGGAIIGSASDSARQQSVQHRQDAYNTQIQAQRTAFAEREMRFRRAMSACLEGRGYSVK
jgi:outer membrane lipoprotein SlyB